VLHLPGRGPHSQLQPSHRLRGSRGCPGGGAGAVNGRWGVAWGTATATSSAPSRDRRRRLNPHSTIARTFAVLIAPPGDEDDAAGELNALARKKILLIPSVLSPRNRSSGKTAPATVLTPVKSILAVSGASPDRANLAGRAATPLTEAGGPGGRPRATARDTFRWDMAHGSSGFAVHKVRCRGPEQQSRLDITPGMREQQLDCWDCITSM
jgi:hypothetical protein